jgi:hypothetical protein
MTTCFYTYAYLRKSGKPYYIGKGKENRAWTKHKGVSVPRDKSKILILKKDLTEEEALKHEVYMIFVLGRKDKGTGTLVNKTDGGEGVSGLKHSENTRKKMSEAKAGTNHPQYGIRGEKSHRFNQPHAQSTKAKISRTLKENPPFKGRKHSEESKKKMSESKLNKKRLQAP